MTTGFAGGSRAKLLCPRFVHAAIAPLPRFDVTLQIGYGSNKKVSQRVNAFSFERGSYPTS